MSKIKCYGYSIRSEKYIYMQGKWGQEPFQGSKKMILYAEEFIESTGDSGSKSGGFPAQEWGSNKWGLKFQSKQVQGICF